MRVLTRTAVAALVALATTLGCSAQTSATGSSHHRPHRHVDAVSARRAPSEAAAATSARTATASARTLATGQNAWVSVAVARLWWSPDSPWSVDKPALAVPVHFRAWLRAMTFDQRYALASRSPTEALLGDRVVVVRLRPHWAKVVVPSQPSQLDPRGYPGWVPRRQLTATVPPRTDRVATVINRTAWLRTDDAAATRVVEISFGTRLPVVGTASGWARVVTPLGLVRRLSTSVAIVHTRGTAAIAPSRDSLVATAKSFLGLDYLFGGLSGFGIDCSGLTWVDYRVHGIRIPRDALPQSRHGVPVSAPRRGDLMFYASNGRVHHVSMYVGEGYMIQAPHTGSKVQITSVYAEPLHSEYVGSRRYL